MYGPSTAELTRKTHHVRPKHGRVNVTWATTLTSTEPRGVLQPIIHTLDDVANLRRVTKYHFHKAQRHVYHFCIAQLQQWNDGYKSIVSI